MATKKASKAKKAVVAKEQPNFWGLSCEIEEVAVKLNQVQDVLSVYAESLFDHRSSIIWLMSDLVGEEIKKLDEIQNKLIKHHVVEQD